MPDPASGRDRDPRLGDEVHAQMQGAALRLGLSPPPDVTDTPRDWAESGVWLTWEAPLRAVGGERYRQEALLSVEGAAGSFSAKPVLLVREPTNSHDANAIRAEIDGTPVGYVARELAEVLAPQLDAAGHPPLLVPGAIQRQRGPSPRVSDRS